MKANIFNIQKFSIHDGPGIRSVVFFKGCPLKCQWCANPESQSLNTEIMWDKEKCVLCKKCENLCPTNSISFTNNNFSFNHNTCKECKLCINQCPTKSLEFVGEKMDIQKVMKEVLKDIDFYEESNGGVTLSGGEVLVWHEFAKELLLELKKHSIHTALETTGFAKNETFQSVANNADLLLFDIKHHNSENHKNHTNVNNELIIENIKWAVQNNIKTIARIPVIPNVNNSIEDAKSFCKLLKEIGITDINLLPFHQFGEQKYNNLQLEYSLKDQKALKKEDLNDYCQVFKDNGFNVTI